MGAYHRRTGNHALERRIIEDDIGRLSAQFEKDTLQRLGPALHDVATDRRRTREADHVHARVSGQDVPHFRGILGGHDVENARRKVRFFGQGFSDAGPAPGRIRGHLQYGRVSRHQGRHELGQIEHEGEIPGSDQPRDTDRLVEHDPLALHPKEFVNPQVALPLEFFGNLETWRR